MAPGGDGLLTAEDLLAGADAVHTVEVPQALLAGAGTEAAGRVRMRPLSVATITLISRAARDDVMLIPLLLVKEAVVEPELTLDQVRRMPVGLVHWLVTRANLISGLSADGEALDEVTGSPLGQAHLLLARHFGWTPEQVAPLTPGQVGVYLAGVERLLETEEERRR